MTQEETSATAFSFVGGITYVALCVVSETQDEEDEVLPRKDYEILDYDRCINEPYVEVLEGMNTKKAQKYEAVRWMLVFAIGVSVGLVGLFVDFFVRLFTKVKFNLVGKSVEECSAKGCLTLSLFELLAFNMTFIFIASVLVLIEPVAAGLGIPEIKSYLNGVKIPGIVRLRIQYQCVCSASDYMFDPSGLFVGKEGPMIHTSLSRRSTWTSDFVSVGAAAGVAAAFGAPIGGTLFSLEEVVGRWTRIHTHTGNLSVS
uniref:Uncharacterized protein n=1 Tax=Oncorhynchus kisutch TaxID=8019 RepID=A0A8C7HTX2_ONCKI